MRRLSDNLSYVKSFVRLSSGSSSYRVPLPRMFREKLNEYDRENGNRVRFRFYDFDTQKLSDSFSRKFLKSRNLKESDLLKMNSQQFDTLLEDHYSYFLYRTEVFKKRYNSDKC